MDRLPAESTIVALIVRAPTFAHQLVIICQGLAVTCAVLCSRAKRKYDILVCHVGLSLLKALLRELPGLAWRPLAPPAATGRKKAAAKLLPLSPPSRAALLCCRSPERHGDWETLDKARLPSASSMARASQQSPKACFKLKTSRQRRQRGSLRV